MNKAFIFDFDGVIINSESIWEKVNKEVYLELLGKEICLKLGSSVGLSMDYIYEKAVEYGSTISKEKFVNAFYERALGIYQTAQITPGFEELCKKLVSLKYKIGIVSASPIEWINIVMNRISTKEDINVIISLNNNPSMRQKPAPDGYIEAMKRLGSVPQSTIVLEDSNIGIASAKAAGVLTIGLKQNLVEGYIQEGADKYANIMMDVIPIIENF